MVKSMFFKQANALVLGTILGIAGISFVDIKQAISQPAPPLSSVAQSAHPLVCDWVQTTTPATNRIAFQSKNTVTILYSLGNYDTYKWAAPNSSSGTVNLTNGIRWINFSINSYPPNRNERYALDKNSILSFLGKQYRCKK